MKNIDPTGIFQVETKVDDNTVASILQKIGFLFFISIPPVGRSGVWHSVGTLT